MAPWDPKTPPSKMQRLGSALGYGVGLIILAVVAFAIWQYIPLAGAGGLKMLSQASAAAEKLGPPQLDLRAPKKYETATFAMG